MCTFSVINDRLNLTSPLASYRDLIFWTCSYFTAGNLNGTTLGNSLCKFADDTYLIILDSNEHSSLAELTNMQNCELLNNQFQTQWQQVMRHHVC